MAIFLTYVYSEYLYLDQEVKYRLVVTTWALHEMPMK